MKHLYLICLSLCFQLSFSQAEAPKIRVVREIHPTEIRLRWAIDEPIAWQKSNAIGFRLERFLVGRNGEVLPPSEPVMLGEFHVPALEKWESLATKNDNAAIVAQALYGESFEVEVTNKNNPIEGIANKASEIDQRFSFALMAADLDFEVAQFAGWGFIDKQVQKGEKYLYKVTLLPNEKVKVEEGFVSADMAGYEPLPAPIGFSGFFQDRKATLSWDYSTLQHLYNYYFIERSEKGDDFRPLSDTPIGQMHQEGGSKTMLYIDSIPQNNKEYAYRLRGKTIFGTFSPYSKVIKGKGITGVSETAQLTKSIPLGKDKFKLFWQFSKDKEVHIKHFALLHSADDRSYKVVQSPISSHLREITVTPPLPSNYYKIRTVGKDGSEQDSFSVLVQPDDETPPAVVQEVSGAIDSLGVVTIRWKANTERDLEGYHVFRGNRKGEEMMRITPSSIQQTQIIDSVSLKQLNDKVYYYVTAIDVRKNQSAPSKILEIVKPDKIAPTAPIITDYKETKNGSWEITWQKSFSTDVIKYHLFRKQENSDEWQWIYGVPVNKKETYTYTEKRSLTGDYRYAVRAEDASHLLSDYSPEIRISYSAKMDKRVLRGLNSKQRQGKVLLSWLELKVPAQQIIIYKALKGDKPTLWRTLKGNITQIEDSDVSPDNTYIYWVKPILENNQPVPTEKIEVMVK